MILYREYVKYNKLNKYKNKNKKLIKKYIYIYKEDNKKQKVFIDRYRRRLLLIPFLQHTKPCPHCYTCKNNRNYPPINFSDYGAIRLYHRLTHLQNRIKKNKNNLLNKSILNCNIISTKKINGTIINKKIIELSSIIEKLQNIPLYLSKNNKNNICKLYCLQTIKLIDSSLIYVARFSLCGKLLALAGSNSTIYLYTVGDTLENIITNNTPILLSGHHKDIIDLSWSNTSRLQSASADGTVRLWDTKKRRFIQIYKHPDIVSSVRFHPVMEEFFATACFDQRIRIWNTRTQRIVNWVQLRDAVTCVSFNQNGSLLAVGTISGLVRLLYLLFIFIIYFYFICYFFIGITISQRKYVIQNAILLPQSKR